MGWDTGLADRIRAKGVRVVEVAGWKTRGSTTYTPTLGLHHHTAGSSRGATPSLAVVIYGRSDLPGPLAQVLQSREPDGDDIAYVVAAGRANHAGRGVWRGVSGNSRAGGVEVEHTGTGRVSARRLEITCRILAALLEGGSRDSRNACQHFEYAQPAGRKIDFHDLAPQTTSSIRLRVAYWIGRTTSPEEGFLMAVSEKDQELAVERIHHIAMALQVAPSERKNYLGGVLLEILEAVTALSVDEQKLLADRMHHATLALQLEPGERVNYLGGKIVEQGERLERLEAKIDQLLAGG